MRYMPACSVSIRAAAWRHLRVKEARRSRKVPFNRSIKAVLNSVPPFVSSNSSFASVGAKLTYMTLVPSVLQERPKRLVGDDESESGSTARDGGLVSVVEPSARAEQGS